MIMKVTNAFFEAGAAAREESIVRYIQRKYGAASNADFFNLGSGEESLQKFAQYLLGRDILDEGIIDRLIGRIMDNDLHPLQCLRLAQVINDPDEELEGEDKEVLIEKVLELTWPKQLKN
ncbi:hypothetical protein SAMN04487972_1693 [Paracoccus halophilus]|uniref:Uncharacterized protein n=1 Tax=Paracoccus halophilus TaxID=376733 RepID=A0A099ET47_9RHOB|nr:hypothetical protein [Paracoccus halophilus]KGJ01590.1 hypothetical protein IT41_19760 [Paracoccus halophilus]SFA62745.1 hypothetical protein SAMN04487972_1693 [Paracoccus halophilus]